MAFLISMTKQIQGLPRCLEFATNILPRMSNSALAIIQILSIDLAFQSTISSFNFLLYQILESFKNGITNDQGRTRCAYISGNSFKPLVFIFKIFLSSFYLMNIFTNSEIIFWKIVLLIDNCANKLFTTQRTWNGASTWR